MCPRALSFLSSDVTQTFLCLPALWPPVSGRVFAFQSRTDEVVPLCLCVRPKVSQHLLVPQSPVHVMAHVSVLNRDPAGMT